MAEARTLIAPKDSNMNINDDLSVIFTSRTKEAIKTQRRLAEYNIKVHEFMKTL